MLGLWIALAGIAVYVGSGFIPWTAFTNLNLAGKAETAGTIVHMHGSAQLEEPWVLNMWQSLGIGFGANFWSTLLWLTPVCMIAILVLTILQLARRQTSKPLALSVFILSIVAFLPMLLLIITLSSPEEMAASPMLSGSYITMVGAFVVILGSTLTFYRVTQLK